MDKIVSPYKNIKQYTRIKIEPYHMNSDIRNNMKMVLKKKLEKKCNKNGFIDEVYKIMEFSDGIMLPENLDGSAIYNITYHCRICIPVEHTIIICRIEMLTPDYIFARNGPISIFNPKNFIDNTIWDFPNGCMHKKLNKRLSVGEYVKVRINNKRINKGDLEINVIGRLLDYATNEEVEKLYSSHLNKNEIDINEMLPLDNKTNNTTTTIEKSNNIIDDKSNIITNDDITSEDTQNRTLHTSKKKSNKKKLSRKSSSNFII